MKAQQDLCPLCGGRKTSGETTFSADLGSGVVVVRHVQATVCSQCGEEWIDDATARRLEEIVAGARHKQLEVEVASLAGPVVDAAMVHEKPDKKYGS
ncbi:MAG: type II toxin-antitoxin system MqsA family antitoxin [Verrucomicrobiia bacterium]|jgi:YgiT-type zinc finger domain-containing protein